MFGNDEIIAAYGSEADRLCMIMNGTVVAEAVNSDGLQTLKPNPQTHLLCGSAVGFIEVCYWGLLFGCYWSLLEG